MKQINLKLPDMPKNRYVAVSDKLSQLEYKHKIEGNFLILEVDSAITDTEMCQLSLFIGITLCKLT